MTVCVHQRACLQRMSFEQVLRAPPAMVCPLLPSLSVRRYAVYTVSTCDECILLEIQRSDVLETSRNHRGARENSIRTEIMEGPLSGTTFLASALKSLVNACSLIYITWCCANCVRLRFDCSPDVSHRYLHTCG